MFRERALARRSQLFVPANRPKFVTAAGRHGADAIILDLEDSVPPDERGTARDALADAVRVLSEGHHVSVRVNKPFEVLVDDLDAAVAARPAALVLPKVESAVEVNIVDALVGEREIRHGIARGSIELQVLVETCLGLANVLEIAGASQRMVSLTLGVEDLAKELEVEPGTPEFDLSWAHSRVLMAARAAGVAPYGLLNSLSNFTDLDTLAANVRRSQRLRVCGGFLYPPQPGAGPQRLVRTVGGRGVPGSEGRRRARRGGAQRCRFGRAGRPNDRRPGRRPGPPRTAPCGSDSPAEQIVMTVDRRPRSREVTQGYERAPHRVLLRAVGMGEDWDRPQVGVASS